MQKNTKILKIASGSSPNSAIVRFNKGPKIAVHVLMEGDSISSSTLTLSEAFQCTGANPFLLKWLEAYSEQRAAPLSLLSGTVFQQHVLKAISTIAFGQTVSYQKLAQLCGRPHSARAIGNACGRNPCPLFVPCHRVIRSDGSLGGFAVDLEIKRRLLSFEQSGYYSITGLIRAAFTI